MNAIKKLAIAIVVGVAIFWLIRIGGWAGALTTQRTPLYFTLNQIGAWVAACIAGVMVFVQVDKA